MATVNVTITWKAPDQTNLEQVYVLVRSPWFATADIYSVANDATSLVIAITVGQKIHYEVKAKYLSDIFGRTIASGDKEAGIDFAPPKPIILSYEVIPAVCLTTDLIVSIYDITNHGRIVDGGSAREFVGTPNGLYEVAYNAGWDGEIIPIGRLKLWSDAEDEEPTSDVEITGQVSVDCVDGLYTVSFVPIQQEVITQFFHSLEAKYVHQAADNESADVSEGLLSGGKAIVQEKYTAT